MRALQANVPFLPSRWPFFYGWWIVVVATIGIIMSIPGQTMGVSVFTDHLIEVTGLDRLSLSLTYLVGTLASSVFLPRFGVLLDRLGSRRLTMGACVVLALTLCGLSRIDRLAGALAAAVGLSDSIWPAAVALAFAFTLIRLSGQGVLTMSSRTMLARWFDARRGLASGISGVFVSFGFASGPPILQLLIDLADWRGAWLLLAAAVGLGMTTVAWVFYRDTPEECGLRMDGAEPRGGESGQGRAGVVDTLEEIHFTRGEALGTAGFWYVSLALSVSAMVYTGITFHIVDIGSEAGVGGEAAISLFLPIAAVSTLAGLGSGWAADRVPVRALVMVFAAAQGLGFLGASHLAQIGYTLLMVVGWGVSGGLYGTLMSVALPRFFGRKHLGAISSIQMSCMVAGSAAGPALLAAAKRSLGGYSPGLQLCCAFSIAAFAFAALAPNPRGRPGTARQDATP